MKEPDIQRLTDMFRRGLEEGLEGEPWKNHQPVDGVTYIGGSWPSNDEREAYDWGWKMGKDIRFRPSS